jgi:hypothetical protein
LVTVAVTAASVAAAACDHRSSGKPDGEPIDASFDVAAIDASVDAAIADAPIDAYVPCNPVAQSGCQAGEKCTWIIDIDGTATTNDIGHVGCVAVGATPTADGAACNDATAGANGGADTCVAGDLCISRKCKPICDPQLVDGSAAGACETDFSCSIYAGVFESGGMAIAGVCEPGCDPLTQKLKVGTANLEGCGSQAPAAPSGTCVPSRGFLSFHCAPSGSIVYGNTDRKPPLTDAAGHPFGNGCAPGFMPFYNEDAFSMTKLCSGMCAPVKMDTAIATAQGTPLNVKPWGDSNALGKLVADPAPVAGHSICTAGVKGSLTVADGGVEDCRYLWFPLAGGDSSHAVPSPYNDTLGFCFAYSKFLTVTLPGIPDKQPQKSCAELPVTAPAGDPYGSAVDNGCYPLSESCALGGAGRGRLSGVRTANGAGLAVRHVFE